MAKYRPPQAAVSRRYLLPLIALPVIVVAGLTAIMLGDRFGDASTLDGDLCREPSNIKSHAVFLMDLRKPLGDADGSLPGALLRDVTFDLEAGTELRVFDLTGDLAMPLRLVGRLCKPYGNAELTVADGAGNLSGERDCDDLPRGLHDAVRDRATRFCSLRDELSRRIDDVAKRPNDSPVANAYLMEGIEDASLTLADRPGRRVLYVFSDMMQHAAWYSHLELGGGWSYDDFTDLRQEESTLVDGTAMAGEMPVQVFYVPREELTDEPSAELAHKQFWQGYFAANRLTFKNVPVQPGYDVEPLVGNLPEAERLERRRRDYQRRRERAELALRELQEELSTLKAPHDQAPTDAALEVREAEPREPEPAQERRADRQAPEVGERPPVADINPAIEQPQRPPEAVVDQSVPPVDGRAAEVAAPPEPSGEQPPVEAGIPRGQPTEQPPVEAGIPPAQPTEQPAAEAGNSIGQPPERPPGAPGTPPGSPPEQLADDVGVAASPLPAEPQPVPAGLPAEPSGLAASPPTPIVEQPPCSARAKPGTADIYPFGHRVNYGNAEIVVRFMVDEQGQTEDDGVAIVEDESSATKPRYFELFATTTIAEVKSWEFDFVDAADSGCRKRQEVKTKLVFRFLRR